jgi:hypothetical protein
MNDDLAATHVVLRPGAEGPEIAYDGPPDYPGLVDLLGGYPVQVVPLLNGQVELNLYEGEGRDSNLLASRLVADTGRTEPHGVAVITGRNGTSIDSQVLADLVGLMQG